MNNILPGKPGKRRMSQQPASRGTEINMVDVTPEVETEFFVVDDMAKTACARLPLSSTMVGSRGTGLVQSG